MEAHAARVVVIGPEASGKTTLARELAAAYGAPWTPEAARLFAESFPAPLSAATVAPIARLSMRLEDEAVTPTGLLFRDTDLVSTVVYARHYYGAVEEWIVDEALRRRADLYLLCHPDLPWIPDGIRDRPLHRDQLFGDFGAELRSMRARVAEVSGDGEDRRLMARRAVDAFLADSGRQPPATSQ